MKKILLAVTAALAITSCSQNEEFENAGQKAEINFGSIVGNLTKASITTKNNFKAFTVNGFRTTAVMAESTQLATGFMDKVLVEKADDTDVWGMANTYYWPTTGYVQFFATSSTQELSFTPAGYPTFEYTVGAIDDQEDLLVANQINKEKSTISDNGVILPFKHALTQVNFSVKGDTKAFTYKISELSIEGVKNEGIFKFDGTDAAGKWTSVNQSTPAVTYAYTPVTAIEFTTNDADAASPIVKLEKENESLFMMLPQEMASNIVLSISYIAIPKDKTAEIDQTFSGIKKVALTGKWEIGKKVRYTLTLTSDAKPVTLGTPDVEDWKEDSDTPLTPETPSI